MNTKSIIEIFRGDDSDALGYQTIVGTIHTDLDLSGCKAVFRYLGFFQEFDPIPEDGKLTIVIPSASSMQFPPGLGYASLKVYDVDRKVRTFTNRIPVFVQTKTPCRCGGNFDVEFSPFPELEPLKIFKGPGADDFDLYTGFITKIINRASSEKYGLAMLFDAMDPDKSSANGYAASPAAVKAAYDAIIKELTDNYYNKQQTDEAIDKLAAYYITSDAQGNPFSTHSALVNAATYYSGGSVRTPTRNDYAIVLSDETHNNEEWRYIYAENAQGVGRWEPQYSVEGVITFDDYVTKTSGNGVKSSGIWSMIWGALSTLPTGFSSLYDWCVAQLAGKASTADATLTEIAWTFTFALTDAQKEAFSLTPGASDDGYALTIETSSVAGRWALFVGSYNAASLTRDASGYLVYEGGDARLNLQEEDPVAIPEGYRLGPDAQTNPNRDKPLASKAEAEALRNGKLDKSDVVAPSTSASDSGKAADAKATGDALAAITPDWVQTSAYSAYDCVKYNGAYYYAKQNIAANTAWNANNWGSLANLAAVVKKFLPLTGGEMSGTLTVPHLTASTGQGDGTVEAIRFLLLSGFALKDGADTQIHLTDGTIDIVFPKTSGTLALTSQLPYALGTPIVIDTASSETVEGETVYYGAATLANRTANIVQVTAATALDELRITFPAATSGKVRDFGLRVEIGTGSAALTAPALVPIAPTGETIKIENADRTIPELADGTATAKGVTLLYFSETSPGVFVVKGEQVEEVA